MSKPKVLLHGNAIWGEPTSEGNSGAFYGTVHAVLKREPHVDTRHVANELIANRLALALGLPVPAGSLVVDSQPRDGDPEGWPVHGFAYACFRLGEHDSLPRGVLGSIAREQPWLAAGIAVFDAWVANPDRHPGNVAYVPKRIPLAIYDHAVILGGESRASLRDGDPLMTVTGGLGPHLDSAKDLMTWVDCVRRLPAPLLDGCLAQIRDAKLLSQGETRDMRMWLDTRSRALDQLVRDALAHLPDWRLV